MKNIFLFLTCSPTFLFIIFGNFTRFEYNFHSPQLKWNLISSTRNFILEFPHELPNDLGVFTLENKEILEKSQNYIGTQLIILSPLGILIFDAGAQKYAKSDIIIYWFCVILLDF